MSRKIKSLMYSSVRHVRRIIIVFYSINHVMTTPTFLSQMTRVIASSLQSDITLLYDYIVLGSETHRSYSVTSITAIIK